MTRFLGLAALAAAAALAWTAPAEAFRPAPLEGAATASVQPAQFRFPWEGRAQKKRAKPKRSTGRERARPAKPAAAGQDAGRKATKGRKGASPPVAAPVDPLDAALPPVLGPLDVATPRGGTQREADGWKQVASQVPTPAPVPLLPSDGPGPVPAATLAALKTMETAPPPLAALAEDDDETPDMHVPLPPVRPAAPGEQASRRPPPADGLAPEGGLVPEGGLSPDGVPLPPRRPGGAVAGLEPEGPPEPPPGPSAPDIPLPVVAHDEDPDCRSLAADGFAEAERIPPIEGPGVCGGGPLVSLTGVKRKDGGEIKIKPAATLRCSMARELVDFVRDDVAPAAQGAGGELTKLEIAGSFQCRGRNGAAGGKMSEHGRANAVDLSGFAFADGRSFGIFSPDLPETMSNAVKAAACARFSTVLGPGSDGFHETHLHVDLQPRRSKGKLCQWADPQVARSDKDADKPDTAKTWPQTVDDDSRAEKAPAKDGADGKDEGPAKPSAAEKAADETSDPTPKRKASAANPSSR